MEGRCIANYLKMPEVVTKGKTIITIYSRNEILLDNYMGIIHYDKNKIIVNGRDYNVEISGENLVIEYFTDTDFKITGLIKSVWWG